MHESGGSDGAPCKGDMYGGTWLIILLMSDVYLARSHPLPGDEHVRAQDVDVVPAVGRR